MDSQEDKRIGVTKNSGDEGRRPREEGITTSAENSPTPTNHPVCRREEEEAGGGEGCRAVGRSVAAV